MSIRRRARGLRRRGALIGVPFLLAGCLLPALLAAPAEGRTLTPLQQGLRYYAGKTLTFIVSTSAGAAYDVEARTLAPVMGAYLHATINVEDIPGGSGNEGQDELAAAPDNGLTIGYLATGTVIYDLVTHSAGINFNPERLAFLGGVAPPDHTLVVEPNSPYKTFAELRKAPASAPATLLTDNGSTTSLEQQLLVDAFGLHVTAIRGYSNSTTQLSGFIRGDGMGLFSAVSTVGPLLVAGKALDIANIYALPSDVQYASATAGVPTVPRLAKEYPPSTKVEKEALATLEAFDPDAGEPFAAPGATPPDEVTALRAALLHALGLPSMKLAFAQQGHLVDAVSGQVAKQRYITGLDDVLRYAGPLGLTQG